jgi:hypothetical protein
MFAFKVNSAPRRVAAAQDVNQPQAIYGQPLLVLGQHAHAAFRCTSATVSIQRSARSKNADRERIRRECSVTPVTECVFCEIMAGRAPGDIVIHNLARNQPPWT